MDNLKRIIRVNILYKYCDPKGGLEILKSGELKLPFVSDVNDPYEVNPYVYCGNDKEKLKQMILSSLSSQELLPENYDEDKILDDCEKNNVRENLIREKKRDFEEMKKRSCLLSVSGNKSSSLMWAHYAQGHCGIAIGIDFNLLFLMNEKASGIRMKLVDYLEERVQFDVLDPLDYRLVKDILKRKSIYWKYEEEFRCLFAEKLEDPSGMSLESLHLQGLAVKKDFEGKDKWFVKFNPDSVREIIFGIQTEDSLKERIISLKEKFPNVNLYQAEETETYKLKITKL